VVASAAQQPVPLAFRGTCKTCADRGADPMAARDTEGGARKAARIGRHPLYDRGLRNLRGASGTIIPSYDYAQCSSRSASSAQGQHARGEGLFVPQCDHGVEVRGGSRDGRNGKHRAKGARGGKKRKQGGSEDPPLQMQRAFTAAGKMQYIAQEAREEEEKRSSNSMRSTAWPMSSACELIHNAGQVKEKVAAFREE
jgi:hypothetical protein